MLSWDVVCGSLYILLDSIAEFHRLSWSGEILGYNDVENISLADVWGDKGMCVYRYI